MSKSYDRNIERLKANQRQISAQEQNITTQAAQMRGQEGIRAAQDWEKLTPFSNELKAWKKRDIEKQKAEGIAAARKARLEKSKLLTESAKRLQAIEEARRVGELAAEFEDAEAQDMVYQRLKKQMLQSAGTSAYPDADRLSQLSPWQQVGYSQEKLRVFNESFSDKLAHAMQNSEEMIEVGGIKFTPKEIADKNLAFPMKQAAIEVLADKIRKNHEIDRFSPEMLKLSKTESVIQKAKDAQLGKYRERYNIESSMNTRQKAKLEWERSEKTAYNLEKLLLMNSATVGADGELLGNTGAWKQVEAILVADGVAQHNPEYAHKILDQPMTDNMCRELGVKKGTTFSKQWPSRTAEIKAKIKEGYVKEVKDEEKFINAAGTELTNEFKTKAREGDLTSQEVNEYKRRYGELGLPIPGDITNYETVSDRNEREDKDTLEALIASQNGHITHEQLDQYHPQAALEYREKATKLQDSAIKKHGAEAKIKASLNTAFTNMGIKGNEKSPAWVEALENAKVDYANKYNRYIAMGYSSAEASHHALYSQQVANKETGEVLPDSMGVLAEIRQNAEGSKYVIIGQSVEKDLKPGHIRVARIASGKREMIEDPNIIINGTIGGDYGKRQLDSIIANIAKHGDRKGLQMDKGAIQYYKGLARGRDGNWMGLVDAQLKAVGHQGLWPSGRPEIQSLLHGDDGEGTLLEGEQLTLSKHISRSSNFPSKSTYLYNRSLMKDGSNRSILSDFDRQENLLPGVVV